MAAPFICTVELPSAVGEGNIVSLLDASFAGRLMTTDRRGACSGLVYHCLSLATHRTVPAAGRRQANVSQSGRLGDGGTQKVASLDSNSGSIWSVSARRFGSGRRLRQMGPYRR